MSDIEIGISKKKLSTQEVEINRFDVYDVIEEVDSESLETEIIESELSTEPDSITIEITGLKSVDSVIGLTDTPLYYENGKFFKVEDNKVVYCDITWADITGSIQDNPDLQNQVEEIAKQYSETFILNTVDKAIEIHNENANAHAFLHDLISDNYITLDNKIDILNNILTNSIEALDLRVVDNTDNITTLVQKQATTETDINNINTCTGKFCSFPMSFSFTFTQNTLLLTFLVTKCVGFSPPYETILQCQLGILRFNSILTLNYLEIVSDSTS